MTLIVGEVIAVNGVGISIRIYKESNQEVLFYGGLKYRGISIREHIYIRRGFIDIVCLVEGEYLDEKKLEADSDKISYFRKVDVRPIGYIINNKFNEGIKYMPMIKDKAFLLSENIVGEIYGMGGDTGFTIGSTLRENIRINLPWTRIFNSHIGIFGNTGSGKSNTLAKLYTVIFNKKLSGMKGKSQFIIIDFNGEYTGNQILPEKDKKITILNSNSPINKFQLEDVHFWDISILSLLFQATINTQQPFLKRIVNGRKKYVEKGYESLLNYIKLVFKKTFTAAEAKGDALDYAREIAEIIGCTDLSKHLGEIIYNKYHKTFMFLNDSEKSIYYNSDGNMYKIKIEGILNGIKTEQLKKIDPFKELILRCYLQLCSEVVNGYTQSEHIHPLLSRIKSSIVELAKVIEIVDKASEEPLLHVVSMKKCRSEIKKVLSLLIAKNLYTNHKESSLKTSPPNRTLHIIIDEAHNILSEQSVREAETWRDYRLELFEEIIKEGRKFGVFLTISSQQPADISPTIVSQVHNFFIHRLINDRDLKLLSNTLSTLDSGSRSLIPTLARGCCVVTGTAFDLPMILKIDPLLKKEQRPDSDDVDLEKLWKDDKATD